MSKRCCGHWARHLTSSGYAFPTTTTTIGTGTVPFAILKTSSKLKRVLVTSTCQDIPSAPTSVEQLINERINVIFVDTAYITRPVAYDNKLIDRELETYSDRIVFGKGALYVKSVG